MPSSYVTEGKLSRTNRLIHRGIHRNTANEDIQPLVEQSIQNNTDALAHLLEEVGQDVVHLCICIMGNRPDGEDAAQEVFIKAYRNIVRLKDPAVFRIWLNRIVVNTCGAIGANEANNPVPKQLRTIWNNLRKTGLTFARRLRR